MSFSPSSFLDVEGDWKIQFHIRKTRHLKINNPIL